MSEKIHAHVIEEKTWRILARPFLVSCPRIGDEIRIGAGFYYTVKRVIWCVDEGQRVNIGVERAP